MDTKTKKEVQAGKIKEIESAIIENSTDSELAKSLLDELLSLKGQYDVEPTRLHIPEKDVIKEYDNDSIRIIKCKGCIVWQYKGGVSFIVKPTMRGLYEYIDGLLSMKDKYNELSEDEKNMYDAAYFGMSLILQSPMFAVADEEFFVDFVHFVCDGVKKVSDKLLNQPLQEETPIENAEFETKMEVANELLKDGKYTDKNA